MPVAVQMPTKHNDPNQAEELSALANLVKSGYDIYKGNRTANLEEDKNSNEESIKRRLADIEQQKADTDRYKAEHPTKKEIDPVARELQLQRLEQMKKDAEAVSTAQAKQLGNYQLGQTAEDQYKKAVTNSKEYDPKDPSQFIDNSSWAPAWMKSNDANKAGAARDNWIETFLRDASGAAIAPSERTAYAHIYFAQPGDSDEAVANKEALRSQKMQNSVIGAGPNAQAVLARQSPALVPPGAPTQSASGSFLKPPSADGAPQISQQDAQAELMRRKGLGAAKLPGR